MCFSASVSYGAAAVLVSTGLYALQQAGKLRPAYYVIALIPVFFGVQQGFEGRVWQLLGTAGGDGAIPFALGFHFFSHFLWLWWIPLSSHLLEPGTVRKPLFLGFTLFGAMAGALVYFTLLLNPGWLSVATRGHSIVYDISPPGGPPIDLGVPASVPYAITILIPLLFSSHRPLRIFGGLLAASAALASLAWGYAFVSVWCFFAAIISLYIVFMLRGLRPAVGE